MEDNKTKEYHRRNIPECINFVKKFDTFEDGYRALIEIMPEIKAYGGSEAIYESVLSNILNFVKCNIPSVNSSSYPNTISFSISSREVGIKTDSNIAFGWRIAFDRFSGKPIYMFRISFITVHQYQKKTISELKEDGWEEFSGGSRRPRYSGRMDRTTKKYEHNEKVESEAEQNQDSSTDNPCDDCCGKCCEEGDTDKADS